MCKIRIISLIFLNLLVPLFAIASPNIVEQQLQIPICLAERLNIPHHVLAGNKDFKIIEVAQNKIQDIRLLSDKVRCGGFKNVSEKLKIHRLPLKQSAQLLLQSPISHKLQSKRADYHISNQQLVSDHLTQIEADSVWDTVSYLAAFTNRSSLFPLGTKPAEWLKSTFDAMAEASIRKDSASYFVETKKPFMQPSVVAVIGKEIDAPAIIIGAHLDTLGISELDRMPGAGDDGSGSASIMEAARVLLNSEIQLKRPIYFIWYAAEEFGLVGSQAVVQDFQSKGIPVYAAIQFDMTGFRADPDDKTMWVFQDYTDEALSDFTAKLISEYIQVPVAYSKCGYGCSDHASWMEVGVPAAFPCESSFEKHNPYIHTASDTIDLLSKEHMMNFAKLALAFAIELAVA